MDATAGINSNSRTAPWTNEKHLSFLNSMEASFVRTMFENNGHRHLRLDRYMPDMCDSTLDSKPLRRKKNSTASVDIIEAKGRTNGRAEMKRARRNSYKPYTSSQDQVVPQLRIRRGDNKTERDDDQSNPDVDVAPAY